MKETINELTGIKEKVKASLKIISTERDKVREYYQELEGIVESIDEATPDLHDAVASIDDALSYLSQYI